MTIEIPSDWMGKPIEGSVERVLARKQTPPISAPTIAPITANISNPHDYILIPRYNVAIAKAETHKNKNWYETLDDLVGEGLVMPTIAQFMTHWMNVKTAAVGGLNVLKYADGTTVPAAEVEDLWKYMSSGHRNGCYTWLNARFLESGGNWKMVSEYKGTSPRNVEVDLDCPIRDDVYVELAFNNQGFPSGGKSSLVQYQAGKNIRFFHPRNNAVARFYAYSGGAGLDCYGVPSYRDAGLGVFACAAGNAPQNSGGSP